MHNTYILWVLFSHKENQFFLQENGCNGRLLNKWNTADSKSQIPCVIWLSLWILKILYVYIKVYDYVCLHICMKIEASLPGGWKRERMNVGKIHISSILGTNYPGISFIFLSAFISGLIFLILHSPIRTLSWVSCNFSHLQF